MHVFTIYLLIIINSIFSLPSSNTTNNEKVQQLAFERFQLQDKSKPFETNNNNKHVYNLIYMPADLDGRKLAEHNIKSWWPKRRLTWFLKNHPPTLTMSQTVHAFERAFYLWSQQTALMFKPICLSNFVMPNCINRISADIEIEFSRYEEHDLRCEYKFVNSTLAHAFYPEKGIVHFNMDKNWLIDDTQFVQMIQSNFKPLNNQYQYNLITVAAHEIGHLLGFDHSNDINSIMHEKYRSTLTEFQFSPRDIESAQYLYGKPHERFDLFKFSRRNRKRLNLTSWT